MLCQQPHPVSQGPRQHPDQRGGCWRVHGKDDRRIQDLRHLRRHQEDGRERRLHQQTRQEGRSHRQEVLDVRRNICNYYECPQHRTLKSVIKGWSGVWFVSIFCEWTSTRPTSFTNLHYCESNPYYTASELLKEESQEKSTPLSEVSRLFEFSDWWSLPLAWHLRHQFEFRQELTFLSSLF